MDKSLGQKPKLKWYKRNWFIILMLIFVAPIGIFLVWKYSNWSKATKIIVSILASIFFVYAMVSTMNAPPTLSIDNTKNSRIETEESRYKVSGSITGADSGTTLTVNDKSVPISSGKFSTVVELKEGDNTIVVRANKKGKIVEESAIINRISAAEVKSRKDAEAAKEKVEQEQVAKNKSEADAASAAKSAKAEKQVATPAPAPAPTVTVGQKNALKKAKDYLAYTAFSYEGLIGQLEFEQFSTADATYGADNVNANWNEQAAKKAKSYMDYSSFSRGSLVSQLEFDKFTTAQANYGADSVGL